MWKSANLSLRSNSRAGNGDAMDDNKKAVRVPARPALVEAIFASEHKAHVRYEQCRGAARIADKRALWRLRCQNEYHRAYPQAFPWLAAGAEAVHKVVQDRSLTRDELQALHAAAYAITNAAYQAFPKDELDEAWRIARRCADRGLDELRLAIRALEFAPAGGDPCE